MRLNCLEILYLITHSRIPLGGIGQSYLIIVEYALAGSSGLDRVELVAVGYHAILNREGRFHFVPGSY